jgi:hypothetical protein
MKWIKNYESKTDFDKYKDEYKKILDKFETLTKSIDKEEVLDRFLALEDLLGKELKDESFFIKAYFKNKDEDRLVNFSTPEYLWMVKYDEIKLIYDNILIDNIILYVYFQFVITCDSDTYKRLKNRIEDEISEINGILNSMGYDLETDIHVSTHVTLIKFMVIKNEVDPSSIIEEPEYHNLLPTPFIKDFTEFMIKYSVSDEDRLDFAKKIKKSI